MLDRMDEQARGGTLILGGGFASRLGRTVIVLEPGWSIEGVERAATPAEAVEAALADLG